MGKMEILGKSAKNNEGNCDRLCYWIFCSYAAATEMKERVSRKSAASSVCFSSGALSAIYLQVRIIGLK
jgi:hypothetical protein